MQNKIAWSQKVSVCVVAFSRGYPGTYQEGFVISGLEKLKKMEDVVAFHANTAYSNNDIVTSGGRVFGVTATASHIKDARAKAYRAIEEIYFEGMHYRKDIGDN
jgi:phosphoribosylamine--glycine ligase